eukprot:scaffold7480_cov125-Isochrysis_galbana.AAC.3
MSVLRPHTPLPLAPWPVLHKVHGAVCVRIRPVSVVRSAVAVPLMEAPPSPSAASSSTTVRRAVLAVVRVCLFYYCMYIIFWWT